MKTRRVGFLLSLACLIGLMALGLSARARYVSALNQARPAVVLDAGHGGFDPGAVGASGVCECDINLSIAAMLRAELVERGYSVVMTRDDENALGRTKREDMDTRRDIIERSGADYVISIHLNANADTSCYGPVVLYHKESDTGYRLALSMQDTLNTLLEIERPRTVQTGNYFILSSGSMPAVIVECGFLSNTADEALLVTPAYQARVAEAIAAGLDAFVKMPSGPTAQPSE